MRRPWDITAMEMSKYKSNRLWTNQDRPYCISRNMK
jgi:hypothetical protein